MDKTILAILFSRNGNISSREFRVGLSILFLSVAAITVLYLSQNIFFMVAGSIGVYEISRLSRLAQIFFDFLPALVPLSFILSYSSFVLLKKRAYSIKLSLSASILAGIIGFLFFASLIAAQRIGVFTIEEMERSAYFSADNFSLSPIVSCVILGLILIGAVLFIVFSQSRQKEESTGIARSFNKLDATSYAIRLGNLMGVSLGINIIVVLAYFIFGDNLLLLLIHEQWIFHLSLSLPHLILCCFFIKYSIDRLNDAGRSFWWAVGFFGGMVVITVLAVWGIKLYYNTTALYFSHQLCLAVFIAGLYSLFLLPTRANEPYGGENDK